MADEHVMVKAGVEVMRVWARYLSKEGVDYDEWAKDAAPGSELRRWYGRDPACFGEFANRYRRELAAPPAASVIDHLGEVATRRRLVPLTATRDVEHSGTPALRGVPGHRVTDHRGR